MLRVQHVEQVSKQLQAHLAEACILHGQHAEDLMQQGMVGAGGTMNQ